MGRGYGWCSLLERAGEPLPQAPVEQLRDRAWVVSQAHPDGAGQRRDARKPAQGLREFPAPDVSCHRVPTCGAPCWGYALPPSRRVAMVHESRTLRL